MLRYIADAGDARKITLIWSNKTEEDILWKEDLEKLAEELSGLKVHHVLTRQHDWGGFTGYIDVNVLQQLLKETAGESPILLCGPDPMMAFVKEELQKCGFNPERFHTEEFRL